MLQHDIRDAAADIKYAYKMYYKLKTSFLEETLSDVLHDEDTDGFDVSIFSQSDVNLSLNEFSLPSQLADLESQDLEKLSSSNIKELEAVETNDLNNKAWNTNLNVKKGDHESQDLGMMSSPNMKEFEAVETNALNEKAWGEHLNIKKTVDYKKSPLSPPKQTTAKVVLKPELFKSKSFVKRNPRKILSRKSSSAIKDFQSSDSCMFKEKLPDLETILAAKSQDRDKSISSIPIVSSNLNSASNLDEGWLKRCNSMNNLSMDQFQSNIGPTSSVLQIFEPTNVDQPGTLRSNMLGSTSSISFSSLNINSESSGIDVTAVDNICEGNSDGIVENSEDESLSRSIRHVRKKRKLICSSIENANAKLDDKLCNTVDLIENKIDVTDAKMNTNKCQINENMNSLKTEENKTTSNIRKSIKKTPAKPKSTQNQSKYRTRGRGKSNMSYNLDDSNDEDVFRCDNDSDIDPSFEMKKEIEIDLLKENDTKKTVKRSTKKSQANISPKLSKEIDKEPVYIPDIDRLDNVPRVNVQELQKTTEIVEKFLRGENIINPSTSENSTENVNKTKLESKVSSGKLNENFVRLNIKKKVFVRGKKVFNYSRYKKSLWKKKKAAALSGPDMDMGGCDGGVLTCFNCNGVGHFAQQCPVKGDSLLEYTEDDGAEESPFQTLEEVTSMLNPKPLVADKFIGHEIPKDILHKSGILELTRIADNDKVDSVYPTNEDGSVIDTPKEVFDVLKMFGHTSFRHGQENAVMRILSGKSTLVTLSTGMIL